VLRFPISGQPYDNTTLSSPWAKQMVLRRGYPVAEMLRFAQHDVKENMVG